MGRTEKHRTIDKGIDLRTDRLRMTFQNRQFKDEARRNVINKVYRETQADDNM